jgi:type II secretory pathway pseudopilin PulG
VLETSPNGTTIRRHLEKAEDGYVLVAVIFMMALLVLSLSVAVPRVRQDIQRDRELETLKRGKQYIRAVRLYYRKFHRYPPSVDALENTSGTRFLRKRYVDPITGKDDWQPIQFGQNKVPLLGLFGQPVAAAQATGADPGSSGTSSSTNSASASSIGNPAAFSPSSDQTSADGRSFGGGGIVGFSIPSDKASILHYKQQDHYRLWEFVYDQTQESLTILATPGAGQGSGTGSTNGTTSSSSQGTNSNPTPPGNPNPTAPGNPACGGKWGPNGNLPIPCPQ